MRHFIKIKKWLRVQGSGNLLSFNPSSIVHFSFLFSEQVRRKQYVWNREKLQSLTLRWQRGFLKKYKVWCALRGGLEQLSSSPSATVSAGIKFRIFGQRKYCLNWVWKIGYSMMPWCGRRLAVRWRGGTKVTFCSLYELYECIAKHPWLCRFLFVMNWSHKSDSRLTSKVEWQTNSKQNTFVSTVGGVSTRNNLGPHI